MGADLNTRRQIALNFLGTLKDTDLITFLTELFSKRAGVKRA
jgi:hypothetical protein